MTDRRLDEGFEGAAVTVTPSGVEVIGASRKMPTTGWILVGNMTTEEAFAPIRAFKNRVYTGALLVSLAITAVLYFLLRQQLAPLDRAGTAMQRMTTGIEPFGAIPVKRDDEIGRLVRSFNELVAGRQRAEDEIRDLNRTLEDRVKERNEQLVAAERNITERQQLEEELHQRTEELALEGRRKDEFLAMLGHELRNPLAPIRTTVAVLKRVDHTNPRIAWATGIIERQTHQLSRLVDDLLDVARISRGKVTLRREPLDVAVAVKRACETSRPFIEMRRHALTVKLPYEPLYVEGDLVRLSQVIGNLLSNAAKFTNEGGAIEVSAERVAEVGVIVVRDNGFGIAREMLGRVFDLFAQADRTLDRAQGGLGIGLKVVQEIVRLHGGKVEARSEGIGKGSEFIIRLPLLETAKPVLHEHAANAIQKCAVTRRVLVVDDNVDSTESLSVLLKMEGHDVWTAHDGGTALQAAAACEPDIVLLDIGLPGMNGYDVVRELRAQRQCAHTFLIALTGYGQPEDVIRAKVAGFDHHLVKPVDPTALSELLLAGGHGRGAHAAPSNDRGPSSFPTDT